MAIKFRFGARPPQVSVLMVCTANICRSPLAHGLLLQAIRERGLDGQIAVDSAGTRVGMKGQRPDPRAQTVAQEVGVDISRLKARQLSSRDIDQFDYIVAMDSEHLETLEAMCPSEHRHKLALIMEFASSDGETEIPDPYFGNDAGFERVLDLLGDATLGLLDHIVESDFANNVS